MIRPVVACCLLLCPVLLQAQPGPLDRTLESENAARGATTRPLPAVDDLGFLRRVSIDLVGRIPTTAEIDQFLALPEVDRRNQVVDRLIDDARFADRWTIFYGDMLRLRSNSEGGATTTAFVHRAIEEDMPYDELARRLITAGGKVGATPEIGFILGDNADPMALAGATSQVFLGLRVACAQCHDHPFDVWTREDFYGLAAYFGRTRRVESQFTNTVFTQEVGQSTVMWPPEEDEGGEARKPMIPSFLYEIAETDRPSRPIARLQKLREEQHREALAAASKAANAEDSSIEDLLADAADRVKGSNPLDDVVAEAKRDAANAAIATSRSTTSELRIELAGLITNPHNRYFSRSFVNRVWAELVGRGFVDPVDDFSGENPPSHPKTLDYLADEFVAHGFDLKNLVRQIVLSETYQRQHAVGLPDTEQQELELAFHATPARRMHAEAMYDSIVTAGHLFDVKHAEGQNLKVAWRQDRVAKERVKTETGGVKPRDLVVGNEPTTSKPEMKRPGTAPAPRLDLEQAIELDFDKLLTKKDEPDVAKVDQMQAMSTEEIEAMRMAEQMRNRRPDVEYFDRFVRTVFDDNPTFNSSLRMAAPAAPEHFLRVFGQPARLDLGEERDHTPSMRQALMLLNGRLTHEASRVGELEPVHTVLTSNKPDLPKAVRMAYVEILTREPSEEEVTEGQAIVTSGDTPLTGMQDLRWVLLNCNEFRFIP